MPRPCSADPKATDFKETSMTPLGSDLPASTSRRRVLTAAAVVGGGMALSPWLHAANGTHSSRSDLGATPMGSTITTKDGTQIFYKDWGKGQPVVFSHGWPLSSDAWDVQMMFLSDHGYRTIAHDRRSHGRSTQTWDGNDMDTYADDLAALLDKLDVKNATLVGHSTGGGEVAHYIGRHGTKRVGKVVLVAAVPPQ